ncbi:O-methyltransferase [Corynebacterium sp. H130]|uniref:O-methyltransferase n=1 Tax=Corynebacterium sp. H130 TaxID=3133444 RepID=UPI0030967C50
MESLSSYILNTTENSPALGSAYQHAEEFHLSAPDAITGGLLRTLAAGAARPESAGAIVVTSAASVVGLYLLEGLGPKGHLTCIDPETEHQRQAKSCFQEAGYKSSSFRFLPSRPLEVMGRLANDSYQFVYGDITPVDQRAFFDAAWPLLASGGVLVLADSLLDGTLADTTRTDRDTVAARDMDAFLRDFDGGIVTRLPLGAGITIVTKK